jgi:hypothetical protein
MILWLAVKKCNPGFPPEPVLAEARAGTIKKTYFFFDFG